MRLLLLPLLTFALASCGKSNVSVTQHGRFDGQAMAVANLRGNIDAYAPAVGQAPDEYTVTQTTPARNVRTDIRVDRRSRTLTVCPAPANARVSSVGPGDCPQTEGELINYIVRVPRGVRAYLSTISGSVHVTDVSGPVDAHVRNGDIKLQIPSYGNASTGNGNVVVMFGDANWPGTLHFSAERGDVEVWVPATADAAADLHTDHGTIFTDFDLRGSSNQGAETIVGKIGKGGDHGINVRVSNGSIRLLKLTPQM